MCLHNIFFRSFVNSFLLFFSPINIFFFSSLSFPGGDFRGGVTLPLSPGALFLAVLFVAVLANHVDRD